VGNLEVARLVAGRKAVIFDLFFTLTALDSAGPARPKTFEILGVPRDLWTEQLVKTADDRFAGKYRDPLEITRRLAHAIDPSIPEDRLRKATDYRLERFKGALTCVPGVSLATLSELSRRGKKTGLVSNADVVEMAGWSESPLAGLFDSTVFSCEVGLVKPQREIYELSLCQLGLGAAECLFVGDGGSHELEGAREVGLTTVMITGHIRQVIPEKIPERRRHADFEIETLKELLGDHTGRGEGRMGNKANLV
jgi:putative hydrolase of the HAD superfamily